MRGAVFARWLAWGVALALLALPPVGVLRGWFASASWPVSRLVVHAPFRHVSEADIRAAVAPLLEPGFFALDTAAPREALAALPWVEKVEVRKHWPDALEITVREHVAVAHWGEDRLLNRAGAIFDGRTATGLEDLPRLAGPDARVAEVLAFHRECLRILAGSGLVLRELRLSPRGGWRLGLAGGVLVELGSGPARSERLRRLLAVWPQLAPSHALPPLAIDLRYNNGFAVQWADAGAPAVPATRRPSAARMPVLSTPRMHALP